MIAMLWVTAALASDSVALRQPLETADASVGLVGTSVSVAARPGRLALGAVLTPGSFVGAAVGVTPSLGQRPWGVDVAASGGVDVLLASPGLALGGSGSVHGGVRGDRGRWMTGLVLAPGLRLDRPEVALPTFLETTVAVRGGPLWLGALGQAGAVFASGGPPAMHVRLGAYLTVAP